MAAGVSVDYYTRLEQARGPSPSRQVLAALARALRLTGDERDHLFRLAGEPAPEPQAPSSHVRPGVLHLLHHADAAQAVTRALHAPGVDGRVYHAADEAPVTAVELHALNGAPFPDRPQGDADLWHGIVDTTRIRSELGFRPWYPSVWSARDAGAL